MSTDAVQPDRYCINCGYTLRGLARGQCPECGRGFDPGNPRTTAARPVRLSRVALARTGQVLTICFVPLALFFVFWSVPGLDPLIRWLAGILLAPFLLVLLVAVLSRSAPLSRRWRAAGVACAAVLVSIIITDWPFRITFELHRPALNRFVARVRAGETPTGAGPVKVGMFTIRDVRVGPNGNIGLQLTGGAGGGEFLVSGARGAGSWVWYNTNWEQNLLGGWFRVYED